MHRKVQAFSMPGKVSIGQDRNKKDPHRGRKQCYHGYSSIFFIIEIKKIPIGDGNLTYFCPPLIDISNRNKKDPHRGRKLTYWCLVKRMGTV